MSETTRRPLGRRLLRLAIWTLLFLVALVGAAWLVLTSGWGQERVRRLVVARMTEYLDRTVEVGDVDYALRPGSFVLHDLVIASPDPADPPFARVPRVEIAFSLSGFTRLTLDIARVEVVRPVVRLVFDEDGGNNLPELQRPEREGPGRVEIEVGRLRVHGGTLHLDHLALPLEIDATAVRAAVTGAGEVAGGGDRFEVTAAAGRLRTVLPDARPWSGRAQARGVFSPGRVDVTAGRVSGPDLDARFEGAYTWDETRRRGEVAVEARGAAGLANRLGYVEEELGGRFRFTGRVEIEGEGDLAWRGTVRAPDLRFGGRRFTGVVARLRGDRAGVVADVERAGHAGGTLAGVVRVDLGPGEGAPTVEVEAEAEGLALARVLADLDLETDVLSRLTGRAAAQLEYRFAADDPSHGSGRARVALTSVGGAAEGLPLAGRGEVAIRRGVLESDDLHLTGPDLRVAASGRYDLAAAAGGFDFRLVTGDLPRLMRAVPALDVDPGAPPAWFPTAGTGTARGSARVEGGEVALQARVDLRDVETPAVRLSRLTAPVGYEGGVLSTPDLVAEGPAQRLMAAGSYDVEGGRGSVEFRLHSEDLGQLSAFVPSPEEQAAAWLPTGGSGSAEGSLEILPGPAVTGRASFDLAAVETAGGSFQRLNGAVRLAPEGLRDVRLEAAADGGALVAVGSIPLPLDGGGLDLVVEVADFPLERVRPFLPQVPDLAGRVTGRLDVAGRLDDLVGELELTTGAVRVLGAELDAVRGHVAFHGRRVEVEELVAEIDGGRLEAAGTLRFPVTAPGTRLDLQLVNVPLEALAPLVPQAPRISGRASGHVEVTGRLGDPDAQLDLVTGPLSVEGVAVEGVRGRVALRDRRVFVQRLVVEAGGGRLAAAGTARLPLADGELDFRVQAAEFPLEVLGSFVPQVPEVEGRLSGRFEVEGGLASLQGVVEVDTGPVAVAGIRLSGVRGRVRLAGTRVEVEHLEAAAPAGVVVAQGTWDRATGEVSLRLAADDVALGEPPLDELVPADLAGRADLLVTIGGNLEEPRVEMRLAARELRLEDRPLGDQGNAVLTALWNGEAVVARGSLLGLVFFDGGGALTRRAADVTFEVQSGDLGGLVQLFSEAGIAGDLDGSFRGRVVVAGPLDRPGGPDASLRLESLAARYQGQWIEALEPVEVRYRPGAVEIVSLYLGVPGGESELFASGTLGLAPEVPLDLRLQADISASWLELAIPNVDLEGDVELLAVVRGTLPDPRLNGQAAIVGGEALIADFPHALENLSATILLYPERAVLDSLTAEFAGGDLRAAGAVDVVDLSEGLFDYRLQAQVADVAVRYPEGFLLRGGGDFSLTSRAGGRSLTGLVRLTRAFYLQDVPAGLSDLLGAVFERSRLEVAEPDEVLAGTQLNVAVEGRDALRVRNNVADLEGDVDLVIRGSLAQPVIFGQVEIDPGGQVVYADNEYRVERGLLTFANPRRIDPVIDFSATTEVRSYDITLNLTGTLDRLNTTFSSDPPLADLEVVALLTTGQEIRGSGRLFAGEGTGAPGAAATQFLYGQAASVISERVNTLFGFDRFRVAPVAATGAGGSSLAFTVGKQISRDLFVTYSRDPSTSELDILQVEWQADENIVVVLTQRGDRAYSVDVQVERRF
jgi:autotransporter translocation and assembly factor TamB